MAGFSGEGGEQVLVARDEPKRVRMGFGVWILAKLLVASGDRWKEGCVGSLVGKDLLRQSLIASGLTNQEGRCQRSHTTPLINRDHILSSRPTHRHPPHQTAA